MKVMSNRIDKLSEEVAKLEHEISELKSENTASNLSQNES